MKSLMRGRNVLATQLVTRIANPLSPLIFDTGPLEMGWFRVPLPKAAQ
jgi:hypothetical protein